MVLVVQGRMERKKSIVTYWVFLLGHSTPASDSSQNQGFIGLYWILGYFGLDMFPKIGSICDICRSVVGDRIMADFSVNNLYHQYNMPHLNFNCSVLLAPQHLLDCLGN